jgi:hypothetical protein
MSAPANIVKSYCPCKWDTFTKEHGWLLTLGKLVIAVAGIAGAIFSGSWISCIGFALFGLTVLYDESWKENREITDLTRQIQESDQTLSIKEGKIIELTAKLEELEKLSQATHTQLQQDIVQVQTTNHSLQSTVNQLKWIVYQMRRLTWKAQAKRFEKKRRLSNRWSKHSFKH